jgi:hypothetical protein
MSTLQTVSLFLDERKDLETILWNQMKHLPASPQLAHFSLSRHIYKLLGFVIIKHSLQCSSL